MPFKNFTLLESFSKVFSLNALEDTACYAGHTCNPLAIRFSLLENHLQRAKGLLKIHIIISETEVHVTIY